VDRAAERGQGRRQVIRGAERPPAAAPGAPERLSGQFVIEGPIPETGQPGSSRRQITRTNLAILDDHHPATLDKAAGLRHAQGSSNSSTPRPEETRRAAQRHPRAGKAPSPRSPRPATGPLDRLLQPPSPFFDQQHTTTLGTNTTNPTHGRPREHTSSWWQTGPPPRPTTSGFLQPRLQGPESSRLYGVRTPSMLARPARVPGDGLAEFIEKLDSPGAPGLDRRES